MNRYMNYHEISTSLDKKINIVQEKILILNRLQASGQVIPTECVMEQLSKETMLEKEEIAFILEYKSKSYARHNEEYQPILIDTLDSRNKLIDYVKRNITNKQPFTYDIIINIEGYHCTPLRLTFEKKLRIFAIDAADAFSFSCIQFLFALEKIEDIEKEIRIHSGSIQKDRYSCAVFSIQDLNTMSKLGDELDKYLRSMELGMRISELHPRFVKNAQSRETIKMNLKNSKNKKLKVSKCKNLEQYINDYSINIGKEKRNYAIFYKTLKYLQAAKTEVNIAFERGGEQAVQKIIRQRTGGIIWEMEQNNMLNKQVKNIATKLQKLHTTNRVNYNMQHNIPKKPTRSMTI